MTNKNISILGRGIKYPLKRSGQDFQIAEGRDLVFSSLKYILETQANGPGVQGEIPWDSSFGSQLSRLKHKNIINDQDALNELAKYYIIEALEVNEPRVLITDIFASIESVENGRVLRFEINLSTIEDDVEANDVRLQDDRSITFDLPI